MKKLLTVMFALALVLSLSGAATAERKKPPRAHRLIGTVEAIDAAAGTFTVKGRKDSVSLKAGEKVKLEGIAVGDKVVVKHSGDSASSVEKVAARKRAKRRARAGAAERAQRQALPEASPAPALPSAPAGRQ